MEEDIKILEEYLDKQDRKFVSEHRLMILQAVENLITRYKELQKQLEEKEMQHELELIGKEEYTKEAMGEIIENYYTANEDCILKSKLKDWIEQKRDYFDKELQKANSNKNEEIKERIWCASATLEDLEQDFLED